MCKRRLLPPLFGWGGAAKTFSSADLARKGFSVRAWNRTAEKAQALETDGIQAFDTPADAARDADIIVTMLKDGPAVTEAVAAALPGLRKGVIWLQLSTVGDEATDKLAAFAEENGIVFYDAPVQGTRQPAEQGKLVILAAGPEDKREVAQSVFDAIGQRTLWVSDKPGASSRRKLSSFRLGSGRTTCQFSARIRTRHVECHAGCSRAQEADSDMQIRSGSPIAANSSASSPMPALDVVSSVSP
ncbi:NAD(P)-binding domain-containing protein [Paracoccus sp. S3-43]|uniref:NAD(P)-dependent oxidoreductase n=1 Tax=Paracoccus sp. S3-43 TaxID=3030011 RepID=UPI0023B04AA2|nr:NAD(P)-binding domain-containing protein [Paracoccus sp. S3-43]WEF25810.1 NAD(P)-binding domain-containing protein [Paracoccus sp. S3-43]